MTADSAIDLAREAVRFGLVLAGPFLAVALVVGLVMGAIQAATQIHEHTVSFVPKIVAVALALSMALPWLISTLLDFSSRMIGEAGAHP